MSQSAVTCSTVVVGTDGSAPSLRVATRAGVLVGASGATPLIAGALLPTEADDREPARTQAVLRDEACPAHGDVPVVHVTD